MEKTRREVLSWGAAGALLSMASFSEAADPAVESIEKKNLELVNEFCAAWSTLDADKIGDFCSDAIVYQMIDNMPLVKGKEAFVKGIKSFLKSVTKAQWDTLRSACIGNLVINERVDNFDFQGDKPSAHFAVVGLFRIQDGKIVEWKDYRLPKEAKPA